MKKYLIIILCFLVGLALGGVVGFKMHQSLLGAKSLSFVDIGHQSFKAKDNMRSVAYFNKAVALDPNSLIAHVSLADTYYVSKNYLLALEEYKIASQLSRDGGELDYIKRKIDELKAKTEK